MLSLSIFILFGAAFQSASGQDCPVNEEPVECIDLCNTCEPCMQRNPNLCIPGCDCIPGYSRNIEGNCVPRLFCQDNTEIPPNRGCPNETQCDLICKRYAYTLGRCEGVDQLNCVCYRCRFPSLAISDAGVQGISLPPIVSRDFFRSCGCPNEIECSLNCKRRGYWTGICEGDFCRCIPSKSKAIDFPLIPPRDVLQSCGCPNAIECASNCRRRGYRVGVCEDNFCRCIGPLSSMDATGCPDESQCVESCLRFGYKTGFCDGSKCQCLESKPACFYFEVFEEPDGKKCQSGPCHRRCKEQGYRYGLCLGTGDQICGCFKQTG